LFRDLKSVSALVIPEGLALKLDILRVEEGNSNSQKGPTSRRLLRPGCPLKTKARPILYQTIVLTLQGLFPLKSLA
jgi:hypothetical protein